MKNENLLQTLSFLALWMEGSGTELIEAIAPGKLVRMDAARTNEPRRLVIRRKTSVADENHLAAEDKSESKETDIQEVVRGVEQLANYLEITSEQAIFVPVAFDFTIQDKMFGWMNMSLFFGVKNMVLVPLKKEFDQLVADQYFVPTERRSTFRYELNPIVLAALMEGNGFSRSELRDHDYDRYKFVKAVSDLIERRSDDDIRTSELFDKAGKLEKEHADLAFVQQIQKKNLTIQDRTLFYEICDNFVSGRGKTSIFITLHDIYERPCNRFRIAKELKDEKHILQEMRLIELLPANMFGDSFLTLTDMGKQLFLEEDLDVFSDSLSRNKNFVYPDKIAEKTLFYDKELAKQLELFKENLLEENFSELQKRLEAQSLSKGVAALFHGLPGTGKTETALQIARATGRAVFHVDISEAKSCWYGESQKLVKGIFTDYKKLCDEEKRKPILLFNEADALLSSRHNIHNTNGSSDVAQTENAIQNIILEEMEKLDGILIATTNLTDNLDSAFARRFLFKIQFGQPTAEAKQSIWKNKLPWLSDDDCRQLATRHDFSGGEIDNIVRKVVMEEVLLGIRPTLSEIEELCRHEKIGEGNRCGIGFRR